MVDASSGYSINGVNIDEIYARKTDVGNNTEFNGVEAINESTV